jgi:antitoxin Phd
MSAPTPIRIRNRRGELVDAVQISASDAKNGFGRVLDRVAREGGVAITKHDEPCAVLVSIDTFRALAGADAPQLETLSAEFDALLARMQTPAAAAAMQTAFDLTPAQLGRAAVRAGAATARRADAAVPRPIAMALPLPIKRDRAPAAAKRAVGKAARRSRG